MDVGQKPLIGHGRFDPEDPSPVPDRVEGLDPNLREKGGEIKGEVGVGFSRLGDHRRRRIDRRVRFETADLDFA